MGVQYTDAPWPPPSYLPASNAEIGQVVREAILDRLLPERREPGPPPPFDLLAVLQERL